MPYRLKPNRPQVILIIIDILVLMPVCAAIAISATADDDGSSTGLIYVPVLIAFLSGCLYLSLGFRKRKR